MAMFPCCGKVSMAKTPVRGMGDSREEGPQGKGRLVNKKPPLKLRTASYHLGVSSTGIIRIRFYGRTPSLQVPLSPVSELPKGMLTAVTVTDIRWDRGCQVIFRKEAVSSKRKTTGRLTFETKNSTESLPEQQRWLPKFVFNLMLPALISGQDRDVTIRVNSLCPKQQSKRRKKWRILSRS